MITKHNEDFEVHTTWKNYVTSPINMSKMKNYEEQRKQLILVSSPRAPRIQKHEERKNNDNIYI